jgi:hypothetical protein
MDRTVRRARIFKGIILNPDAVVDYEIGSHFFSPRLILAILSAFGKTRFDRKERRSVADFSYIPTVKGIRQGRP